MVSEINSVNSASSGRSAVIVAPQQQALATPASVVVSPKVALPKPVVLNFDEAKSRQNLKEAVSALNDQVVSGKTGLAFSMDESIGRPVVVVRNTESGEVVRQIPNEVVIRVAHSIDALKGLMLNTKV